MMSVSEVPVGSLVFLDCGCCGLRGVGPLNTRVRVAIHQNCATHHNEPLPRLLALKATEEISPFTRTGEVQP